MKISPLYLLLKNDFKLDKKIYFISGNEKTLMEKIKSKIIQKHQQNESVQIKNIDTISDFIDETGLFGNKSIFLVSGYRGIDELSLNNIKSSENYF